MEFDQFVSMWWFMREFKEEEKKRNWEKEKKKKKKGREKCQKEDNNKSSHQILRNEMEGRNTALKKKKRWKKNVEWKFQKELTFRQILKTLLIFTFTHFYFIPSTFTLHYVLIKSLFDLEDCVVQILIWPRRKKCVVNIFGILSWDYLFFLD